MSEVAYSTREAVKLACDSKLTARDNAQVDDALFAATDTIHSRLRRRFYPELATRYFDFPERSAPSWRIWLERNELISVSSVTVAGAALTVSDYMLRNFDGDDEAPYSALEIDRSTSGTFHGADTSQRAVAVLGLYGGAPIAESPAGALAEALDLSETGVNVTNSAAIGVGQLIRVESERMLVTEKSMITTGQSLLAGVAASMAVTSLSVTDGSAFFVGEALLLDSERMLITDISGNTLTVVRAWDGSVLAAHTTPTIFAARTLTVERGALGTTAATHADTTAIVKHRYPALIRRLATAEALVELAQVSEAYARVVGAGENQREASGRGLADLWRKAEPLYKRKGRAWAV